MKNATGTIYRSVHDGLSRVVSSWVGLDDTPTSGSWSPSNTTGTDLVKTRENEHDSGGVGDGNLTKATGIPGGSAPNRVSQYFYDWRNRPVASKDGVEGSESTSLNRPTFYIELDNLNQVVATEQYDADTVTIADSNSDGVPDKPSSSLLRARGTTDFDDQSRIYRNRTYSVDQSTGSVSSNSLATNIWYSHRSQVIKTAEPGGLVTKISYDGATRTAKSYFTDGGGDTAWSDAVNITGDTVLSQSETQFDAASNPLEKVKQAYLDNGGQRENAAYGWVRAEE